MHRLFFPTCVNLSDSGRSGIVAACVLCMLTAAGCASSREVAVLQDELRQREATITALESELKSVRQLAEAQEAELSFAQKAETGGSLIRTASHRNSPGEDTPRRTSDVPLTAGGAIATQLRIHQLLSGVVPSTAVEEPARLMVVLQTLDDQQDVVKTHGTLTIRVSVRDTEDARPRFIAERRLSALESRSAWRTTLMARGIFADVRPDAESLRMIDNARFLVIDAQLILPNGQALDGHADIPLPQSSGSEGTIGDSTD